MLSEAKHLDLFSVAIAFRNDQRFLAPAQNDKAMMRTFGIETLKRRFT